MDINELKLAATINNYLPLTATEYPTLTLGIDNCNSYIPPAITGSGIDLTHSLSGCYIGLPTCNVLPSTNMMNGIGIVNGLFNSQLPNIDNLGGTTNYNTLVGSVTANKYISLSPNIPFTLATCISADLTGSSSYDTKQGMFSIISPTVTASLNVCNSSVNISNYMGHLHNGLLAKIGLETQLSINTPLNSIFTVPEISYPKLSSIFALTAMPEPCILSSITSSASSFVMRDTAIFENKKSHLIALDQSNSNLGSLLNPWFNSQEKTLSFEPSTGITSQMAFCPNRELAKLLAQVKDNLAVEHFGYNYETEYNGKQVVINFHLHLTVNSITGAYAHFGDNITYKN
jgi:hypothetical protein